MHSSALVIYHGAVRVAVLAFFGGTDRKGALPVGVCSSSSRPSGTGRGMRGGDMSYSTEIMYASTYKFEGPFFRHERRFETKFGTHVRIETRLALT